MCSVHWSDRRGKPPTDEASRCPRSLTSFNRYDCLDMSRHIVSKRSIVSVERDVS